MTPQEATRQYNAQQREATRQYNEQATEATRQYNARQADARQRYNAQATEARRQYNAAQDARRAERENQGQQRRTAPTATAQNPASWAEVLILQTGYRAAAMANHPDRGGDHNRMVAINAAYSTLKTQGRI